MPEAELDVQAIAERVRQVRRRVEMAGGDPDAIEIVAATKRQPPAICRAALAAGLTALGENRVQEALAKMPEVPDASWHLIGNLQSNKVKHASRFQLLQSLDSLRLAEALGQLSAAPPGLLQVNVAREPQKHGVLPEVAVATAVAMAELIELRGFMAMGAGGALAQPSFQELRRLRDETEQRLGRPLPVLSMGMSGDLEAAVRAGSTMLRLGAVFFGPRSLEQR
ncbi:MAG: YggS family pyridoxal phosphate-dependent enzyme [Candidatus Dormibacteraeota bacterium]|uniref:Pyridoxal phosphate homeostasis protein n=1 Tax=Candidatus Dormiibacter inghamiae TaxID=3127013 RepID=A0A934KL67_9BACT|nr:YggS family pyridoxal phosphate-dependent enzyme [Candidatus Dormibacteraeota bacterium]MBJ7605821.1 YggS family pyridoxal phosphate-dependent enzyme [Candidatus Dormibacteraeota bacterium]